MNKLLASLVIVGGIAGLGLPAVAAEVKPPPEAGDIRTPLKWPDLANEVAWYAAQSLGMAGGDSTVYVEHLNGITPFPAAFRDDMIRALALQGVRVAPTRAAADHRLRYETRTVDTTNDANPFYDAADMIINVSLDGKEGILMMRQYAHRVREEEAALFDPNHPGAPLFYAWSDKQDSPPTRIIPVSRKYTK